MISGRHKTLRDMFNRQRYPLDRLDSPQGQQLLAQCHDTLRQSGALALPDFFTPASVEAMVGEVLASKQSGHRMHGEFSPYSDNLSEGFDVTLPESHPRRMRLPASHLFLAGDRFPGHSQLASIYHDPEFRAFLEQALGVDRLHPLGDQLGHINALCYEPGDCNGWHFDTNEFIVSIMLQTPEAGGDYEFIPNLRSARDENLDAVAQCMREPDDAPNVQRVVLHPGTLFLFRGEYTLHRVTRIAGGRDRIVAILSYHREAGHQLSDGSKLAMYGKVQ